MISKGDNSAIVLWALGGFWKIKTNTTRDSCSSTRVREKLPTLMWLIKYGFATLLGNQFVERLDAHHVFSSSILFFSELP